MAKRNIYVRDADQELWGEAERLSKGNLSALLTDVLRQYVAARKVLEDEMERIEITVPAGPAGNGDGRLRNVAFTGRWLIDPAEDRRSSMWDVSLQWSVAFTKQGRIAVYTRDGNSEDPVAFHDFEDIDQAVERRGVPEDIAELVKAELDANHVEELDI